MALIGTGLETCAANSSNVIDIKQAALLANIMGAAVHSEVTCYRSDDDAACDTCAIQTMLYELARCFVCPELLQRQRPYVS